MYEYKLLYITKISTRITNKTKKKTTVHKKTEDGQGFE